MPPIPASPFLLLAPTLVGSLSAGETPTSLNGHYLRCQGEAERQYKAGRAAEASADIEAAKAAYAKAFSSFRQAAMLSARCEAPAIPAPVTRLLFQKSTEAAKRWRAMLKATGLSDSVIDARAKEQTQQADAETLAILQDCQKR